MNGSLPSSREGASSAQPLILIVDDDLAVRDSLAAVLDSFGFRTRTAGNGIEALEAAGAEAPSAIITDLHMPGMDGFEFLMALRSAQSDIPVIVISGAVFRGYDLLTAAQHMGAVATFQKPIPVFDVVDMITGLTACPAA